MKMQSLLLMVVFAVHQTLAINDTTVQGTNVYVLPRAQSGKIVIGWDSDFVDDDNRIEVSVYGLQEISSASTPVTAPGHSFSTFSNLTFTVSAVIPETISNVKAKAVTLSTTLPGLNTVLTITVTILQGYGYSVLDGETTPFGKDNVMINIALAPSSAGVSTWPWSGAGGFIDLTLAVRGKSVPSKLPPPVNSTLTLGDTYGLGFGNITFSHKVQIDGGIKTLSTGYPQLQTQQGVQTFTVRVPRYNQGAIYGVLVAAEPASVSGSSRVIGNFSIFISLVALFLAKMFSTA